MRTIIFIFLYFIGISFFSSCDNNNVTLTNDGKKPSNEILEKIRALGFSDIDVKIFDNDNEISFIVENDIQLFEKDLDKPLDQKFNLIIANTEQYRTTLVPIYGRYSPRTGFTYGIIDIGIDPTLPAIYFTALQNAVARYNAIPNRRYNMTAYIGASPGDNRTINIKPGLLPPGTFAIAGFPYEEVVWRPGAQHPETVIRTFPSITLDEQQINSTNIGFLTTLIAHEIGHCIGFRHTDWFDTSFSCLIGGNEGTAGVGAVHIPGTPTNAEAGSWMLACIDRNTDRPFTTHDVIAIQAVHGQ